MPTPFETAAAMSSAAVSQFFGSRIRLMPWTPETDFAFGEADPDRPEVEFVGVLSGPIGTQNLKGDAPGQDFVATATTRDRRVSANNPDWPQSAREGDRVQRVDKPDQPVYQITSIVPDGVARTWANLIEVKR